MTATSDCSKNVFLSPLQDQQETSDFIYFLEKADTLPASLHAKNYFSPLRALFLSQHKNPLAIATLYSPLICRDGLLELCHFFYSYPEPTNANIYLMIKAEFANFVPSKWRTQVGYYEYQSLKKTSDFDEVYLLLTLADKNHCSLDFQRKQLELFNSNLNTQGSQKNIFIVPVSPRTSQEIPELSGDVMAHYSQSIHNISQLCGPDVKALTWAQVEQRPLDRSLVIDMNEYSLLYGDSFLVQHFLKEGGQVHSSNKTLLPENSTSLKMSFHHQLCMNTLSTHFSTSIAEKIETQLTLVLNSRTYLNEATAFDQQMATRRDPQLKDYCPSFKAIIHQTAAEYL